MGVATSSASPTHRIPRCPILWCGSSLVHICPLTCRPHARGGGRVGRGGRAYRVEGRALDGRAAVGTWAAAVSWSRLSGRTGCPLDKPGRLHAQTAGSAPDEPASAGGRARRRHRPDRCRQVQHPLADRRPVLTLEQAHQACHRRRAFREFVPQALALFRRDRPRRVDRLWSRANPRRCRPRAAGSPFWRPSMRPGGTGDATPTRRTDLEEELSWWTSPHVGGAISSACVMACLRGQSSGRRPADHPPDRARDG